MPDPLPDPPKLGPAPQGPPPELPATFQAAVLLTPFNASQIFVAQVAYQSSGERMFVELWGLESGHAQYMNIGSDTYLRSGPNDPWQGPFQKGWTTPATTLLADMGAIGIATAPILEVDCTWWASDSPCTNGCEEAGADPKTVGSWTWLCADDGAPWRMFFVDKSNPYKLPVIGAFAMVNWARFAAGDQPELDEIAEECRREARPPSPGLDPDPVELLAKQEGNGSDGPPPGLIPGLHLPGPQPTLPAWPDTLLMEATTIPTAELTVKPTIVCYDWPIRRMLTRLFDDDASGGYDDLILTDSTTYDVSYAPDGSHECNGHSPPGLPWPNWPEHDNGQVKAVIDEGSPLSPYGTTQLIALPGVPPRMFWVWYTTPDNRAVLFTEVPQLCDVTLVLIDYWTYEPGQTFDPSLFQVPADCLKPRRRQAAAMIGSGRPGD